jgi:hypothetical protein
VAAKKRLHHDVQAVALANKLARIRRDQDRLEARKELGDSRQVG